MFSTASEVLKLNRMCINSFHRFGLKCHILSRQLKRKTYKNVRSGWVHVITYLLTVKPLFLALQTDVQTLMSASRNLIHQSISANELMKAAKEMGEVIDNPNLFSDYNTVPEWSVMLWNSFEIWHNRLQQLRKSSKVAQQVLERVARCIGQLQAMETEWEFFTKAIETGKHK